MLRTLFEETLKSASADTEAWQQPAAGDQAIGHDAPPAHRVLQSPAIPPAGGAVRPATPVTVGGRHARPGTVRAATWQHGMRFTWFSLVGAAVFLIGTGFQWLLIRAGAGPDWSYAGQAVFSIELSFALNRWLTWRIREVRLLTAAVRWNTQKLALTVPNFLGYALLVRVGLNWLAANIAITAIFTVVNYMGADVWSFRSARRHRRPVAASLRPQLAAAGVAGSAASTLVQPSRPWDADDLRAPRWERWEPPWLPSVSVVIPCKDNAGTIGNTVTGILAQDYAARNEVILVGSLADSTWAALDGIEDPRLIIMEQEPVPGKRDPAVKRDTGIRRASGEVIALADSDIVMDQGWLSRAVELLDRQGRNGVICGGMRSIHDTFWGRFVDGNLLGAKTPRVLAPYMVTSENFGRHNRKPPITANVIFTRSVYDTAPLDRAWAFGYEDYEWFWRIAKEGHRILFSDQLNGQHYHRGTFRQLVMEYTRAADGCAQFIRTHPDSPLARKRLWQATCLPLAGLTALTVAGAAIMMGLALVVAATMAAGIGVLMAREFKHSRSAESLTYPILGGVLGLVFTTGLVRGLVRSGTDQPRVDAPDVATSLRTRILHRVSWPLTLILAVQS